MSICQNGQTQDSIIQWKYESSVNDEWMNICQFDFMLHENASNHLEDISVHQKFRLRNCVRLVQGSHCCDNSSAFCGCSRNYVLSWCYVLRSPDAATIYTLVEALRRLSFLHPLKNERNIINRWIFCDQMDEWTTQTTAFRWHRFVFLLVLSFIISSNNNWANNYYTIIQLSKLCREIIW